MELFFECRGNARNLSSADIVKDAIFATFSWSARECDALE